MAENIRGEKSTVTEGSEPSKEREKHRFSEPWEDSDLILEVEDEKFHVHRVILSINSSVFKAMFKSDSRKSIPLPEKKASEVLDFIKQLYVQERPEITMENVDHLLKLSDEYQVKAIFDPCAKFLEAQPKTKENVLSILKLASTYNLQRVKGSCYRLVEGTELGTLWIMGLELDKEDKNGFLFKRSFELETFLYDLYPQFMGLVEYCLWLCYEGKRYMRWCPKHFNNGYSSGVPIDKRITECTLCKEMLITLTTEMERFKKPYRPTFCLTSLTDFVQKLGKLEGSGLKV